MASDTLESYRRKRDPQRTPEPFGTGRATSAEASGGIFVVQQHAARRMHWDLRLEIDGALASWAVPRGPVLDPKERRLAVQTEDHPLEYADFEGIIPPGNYGAGSMIVWDRGTFRTVDGVAPGRARQTGKLDIELRGYKLKGRFALVRTKSDDGKGWLLLSKGRADGGPEIVVTQPWSVLSGLSVDEVRDGVTRTDELEASAAALGGVKRRLELAKLRPMLAQTAGAPFSKPGWIYELKYDGVRVLAGRDANGTVRLMYRSGRDATASFPEVVRALGRLPASDFIIDGEVVSFDERGASSFEVLQQRLGVTDALAISRAEVEVPVALCGFDLLSVAGFDLRGLSLSKRRDLLTRLLPPSGVIHPSQSFEDDGVALFETVSELGLEGIVAKCASSPYRCGERSADWVKIKALRSADLAIVGYTRGQGARRGLGALMLAWCKDDTLIYAGNVGTGFAGETLENLQKRLAALQRATPAFEGNPPGTKQRLIFVEPQLVAEVRFSEVTTAGLLRQPVFVRLRDDKKVADSDAPPVARDAMPEATSLPAPSRPEPLLRLTNTDKIFWPIEGYTKGDLLEYYEDVWPWLEPYLRDRPVVLTRYPDGIEGKSFFQKNAPAFTPQWVQTCHIDDTDFFICNDLQTLLYVINSGCIPLHVWSARKATLQTPDWSILDLDPKGAPFADVVRVARHIHKLLEELNLEHFLKTSGQDGLHILVPLGAKLSHEEARTFAEVLARVVALEQPQVATTTRAVGSRGGKVYVDFLQNGEGKTIASPLSVRPRPGAPVSMPLAWRELTASLDPKRFTIANAVNRLKRRGDPMRSVLNGAVDVREALLALAARLQE
ncbi:MAG TPA: DNA ligase D [Candidatus Acidoferrales bacterium]|nr:DNA ligase D [Candidatus Acidoferrales bacterium]